MNNDEDLLDFDRAMRDFCEMFPRVSYLEIESVLRKYDGDVSATINELLYEKDQSSPEVVSLHQRKIELREKLHKVQTLLDTVTDIELARTYEDQQLAYLLEYREVRKSLKEETKTPEAEVLQRCPEGPLIENQPKKQPGFFKNLKHNLLKKKN